MGRCVWGGGILQPRRREERRQETASEGAPIQGKRGTDSNIRWERHAAGVCSSEFRPCLCPVLCCAVPRAPVLQEFSVQNDSDFPALGAVGDTDKVQAQALLGPKNLQEACVQRHIWFRPYTPGLCWLPWLLLPWLLLLLLAGQARGPGRRRCRRAWCHWAGWCTHACAGRRRGPQQRKPRPGPVRAFVGALPPCLDSTAMTMCASLLRQTTSCQHAYGFVGWDLDVVGWIRTYVRVFLCVTSAVLPCWCVLFVCPAFASGMVCWACCMSSACLSRT